MGVNDANFRSARKKHCGGLQMLTLAVAGGAVAIAVANAQGSSAVTQMQPPKLVPEKIEMGTFYNGARVRIAGTAPAGSGVLVVIRGSERDEFFDRKGRVGPIWMTVDKIHIQHAPSVFLTFASAPLDSLLDPTAIAEYQLSEAAVMSQIRVFSHYKGSLTGRSRQSAAEGAAPSPSYAKVLSADFLRLKEHEGIYRARSGDVRLSAAANFRTQYAVEFDWPKNAPIGNYRVQVYACRGGRVVARSAATLPLVEVGFPGYMAALASKSPWTYGAAAVLVAMLAGFLTDALISSLRRKRRTRKKTGMPQAEPPAATPEKRTAKTHETETAHRS